MRPRTGGRGGAPVCSPTFYRRGVSHLAIYIVVFRSVPSLGSRKFGRHLLCFFTPCRKQPTRQARQTNVYVRESCALLRPSTSAMVELIIARVHLRVEKHCSHYSSLDSRHNLFQLPSSTRSADNVHNPVFKPEHIFNHSIAWYTARPLECPLYHRTTANQVR